MNTLDSYFDPLRIRARNVQSKAFTERPMTARTYPERADRYPYMRGRIAGSTLVSKHSLFRRLRSGQCHSEGLVGILWLASLERQDVRLQNHTFVDHDSAPNRLLLLPRVATGQHGWQVND